MVPRTVPHVVRLLAACAPRHAYVVQVFDSLKQELDAAAKARGALARERDAALTRAAAADAAVTAAMGAQRNAEAASERLRATVAAVEGVDAEEVRG
jgi:hypothetical protein